MSPECGAYGRYHRLVNNTSTLLLTAAIACLAVVGCSPARPAPDSPLSVPPKDTVSIIAGRSNQSTPDHAQWTWSILGERNWTAPSASDTHLTLAQSYPLNDVVRRHGCNTWNCELTLDRDVASTSTGHWILKLHGSNGQTAQSIGTVPLKGGDLSSAVSAVQDRDTNSNLPASLTLATLGDRDITIAVTN